MAHTYGPKESLPKRACEHCGKIIEPRWNKGWYVPPRYCSHDCSNAAHNVPRNKLNARGNYIDKAGYVILSARSGDRSYQQPQHRAVMEGILGRPLEKHETVHHKNGIRTDNRPENLELWSGRHGRGQRAADLPDIWSGNIPPYLIDCYV